MNTNKGDDKNNWPVFIKKVHDAKVITEEKMRKELDKRICAIRPEKLAAVYGNDQSVRLKAYARFFVEMDKLREESEDELMKKQV